MEGTAFDELGQRKPFVPTGMYEMIMEMTSDVLKKVSITDEIKEKFKKVKVLVGCTDVHEYGKMLVSAVLRKTGAEIIDLGCSVDADEVVDAIVKYRRTSSH